MLYFEMLLLPRRSRSVLAAKGAEEPLPAKFSRINGRNDGTVQKETRPGTHLRSSDRARRRRLRVTFLLYIINCGGDLTSLVMR